MTIRTTLVAAALVSTALVAIVGSIGALNRRAVDDGLRSVEEDALPLVKALEDVRFAGLRIVSSTSEYALIRTLRQTANAAPEAEGAEVEVRLRQAGVQAYGGAIDALDRLAGRQQGHLGFAELRRAGSELLATSATLLDLAEQDAPGERILEVKELLEQHETAFLATVDRDILAATDTLNERSRGVRDRVTRDYRLSIIVLLLSSGLALAFGLQVARAIRKPLALLERASGDIAAGHYGVTLPESSSDEVGAVARAFSTMAETLGRTTVSKAFVDDIVESIPDGVLVLDQAHRVVRANHALVALLGAGDERALLGRDASELIPALRHLDALGVMMTSLTTTSGEVVSVAVTASALTPHLEGPAGYVCLVQDIRERLETERVLTDARDQAEAGMRAKSEFMATMSHELRTPLNAIIGYAELLRGEATGRLTDSDRIDLGRIRSSGLLLLGLVNQVLDLARLEAGTLDLDRGPVAPASLLDQVAGLVTPMLSPQTTLTVDVTTDLPTLTTDCDKLRQVLLNLSSNACKFTKEGQVTLTARLRAGHDGDGVEFEVSDTGVGIPAEFLHRLYTPFSQAHGPTAGKFSGSGLGMAIAKRLSDMLGATLTVRSAVGQGTVVSLYVPTESAPM